MATLQQKTSAASIYHKKYGDYFWFDQKDWEVHNRKQVATRVIEEEKRERVDQLDPIITLLSITARRSLKSKEIRLIDGMDESEIATFVKLMSDVIGTSICSEEGQVGYGQFID